MTARSVFALALSLALSACAAPFGVWEARDVRASGVVAESIRLDLQPGDVAVARIVRGGIATCPERYTHEVEGRWFTNAAGELVVVLQCVHEVPHCESAGTFNLCAVLGAVSPGRYVESGGALVSRRTPGVVLERAPESASR